MDFFAFCLCFHHQPEEEEEEDYGDVWRDAEGGSDYDPYLADKMRIGIDAEAASIKRMKLFVGLEENDRDIMPVGPHWQPFSSKDNIEVKDAVIEGSIWQAVKATTRVKADRMKILDLILDDSRIHEYDEMFDFSKVRIYIWDIICSDVITRTCYHYSCSLLLMTGLSYEECVTSPCGQLPRGTFSAA